MARGAVRPRRRDIFPIGYDTGGAPPATPILDGTSPTGAWSLSRDLLTAFAGGSRYVEVSGAVSQLTDQSGNARHLTQAVAGSRPAIATAGPNSRNCADFSTDSLEGSAGSNFITASSGYVIISFLPDVIVGANIAAYGNDMVWGETGGYLGFFLKDTGATDTALAYNWGGGEQSAASVSIVTGTPYIAEWKHSGGNISLRINGSSWVDTVSGDTTVVSGILSLGNHAGAASPFDGKIFEMAAWNIVPTSVDAIAADFKTWVGA